MKKILLTLVLAAGAFAAQAGDLVPAKLMKLELARDIAQKTIDTCRAQGFQVAVVVADRSGEAQVVMRDVFANKFNVDIAARKAGTSIVSGGTSSELRKSRSDIRQELNHIDGLIIMDGGLPIRAGGALVGAVGVSGAPSGAADEACAQKALDAVADRLEFTD